MNTISKDQSIITQVAAKIAADLTPKSDDVQINIANWLLAFDATSDALLEKHGMTPTGCRDCATSVPELSDGHTNINATVGDTASTTANLRVSGSYQRQTARRYPCMVAC
jgi:hypothetical protein